MGSIVQYIMLFPAYILKHLPVCVCVNDLCTNWFQCSNGVRQGDNLSPTLFSLFINDLATEISQLNTGINIKTL